VLLVVLVFFVLMVLSVVFVELVDPVVELLWPPPAASVLTCVLVKASKATDAIKHVPKNKLFFFIVVCCFYGYTFFYPLCCPAEITGKFSTLKLKQRAAYNVAHLVIYFHRPKRKKYPESKAKHGINISLKIKKQWYAKQSAA
jgi:hypothetical protein